MTDSMGRRLLLRVQRARAADADGASPEAHIALAPLPPLVDFVAYTEDRILSGRIRLAAERLTDMLNEHDEYALRDVRVVDLGSSAATEVADLLVRRDDLLVVHASGPRGSQERRRRTRQHALALQLGPLHVRGHFHASPGSDPLLDMRRRTGMVPLTDAWVEWGDGIDLQRRCVAVLTINRAQLDWAVLAFDADLEFPDLPLRVEQGTLTGDFAAEILLQRGDAAVG